VISSRAATDWRERTRVGCASTYVADAPEASHDLGQSRSANRALGFVQTGKKWSGLVPDVQLEGRVMRPLRRDTRRAQPAAGAA
jgi:hypothetical protein